MRRLASLLVLIFLSLQAFGSGGLTLSGEYGGVVIPALKQWRLERDVLGLPYVYFSPKANGQRSSLSIINTQTKITLEKRKLEKDFDSYKEGKEKWAEKVSAKIIEVSPYIVYNNKKGHQVHQVGVKYLHHQKLYRERSYYIQCRDKTLILKSLNLIANFKHQSSFEKIIQEIDCD